MSNIWCVFEPRREPGAIYTKMFIIIINGASADFYYLGGFLPYLHYLIVHSKQIYFVLIFLN